jgi:plasmid stabilization system protein ParE
VPAARRYQGLVKIAVLMISADPLLAGSKQLGEVEQRIRLYHLRHSRNFAAVGNIVVKRPRHFLAYQESKGEILILRLLHDRMDLDSSGLFRE